MSAREWLFRIAIEDVTFTPSIDAITSQIKEIWKDVEADDEYGYGIAAEIEETLTGAATIICQAKILRILKAAQSDPECRNRIPGVERDEVLRGLGEKAATSAFSNVEILWHLGNYFKHAEEWSCPFPPQWPSDGKYKHTVNAIASAGMDPEKTYGDNIRIGAKFLGVADFSDLSGFSAIVNKWSNTLLNVAYPTVT